MAKKEKKVLCDDCIYFTDKCEHDSNIRIILKRRIEKIEYKALEKVTECENYKCLDKN